MAITITANNANSDSSGIDVTAYLGTFVFPGFAPAGYGWFSNSQADFSGNQYAVTEQSNLIPNPAMQAVVFESGGNGNSIDYIFATHVVGGDLNAISFGYGLSYSSATDSFTLAQPDLQISGFGIVDQFGAGTTLNSLLNDGRLGSVTTLTNLLAANAINFVGSTGGDVFTGYSENDTISGYGGNDILDGAGGIDTAVYTGNKTDYIVTNNNNGTWTITDSRPGSADGTDTLSNIEFLQFADQTVAIDEMEPEPNQIPTNLALSASTVAENSAAGTVIGTLSATDADGDALTYTLTDDAGGRFALFVDGGVTKLVVNGALDYEASTAHGVTVKVSDGNGGEATQTFTVNVTDVNENVAPTNLALSNASITEDAVTGTVVGTLSAIDPDGGALTYTLTGGASDKFEIVGNELKVKAPLDFETSDSHQVTVTVTDSDGQTAGETFTISVGNVDEAPTGLALSTSAIAEDAAIGTVVGTLFASDPENAGAITYTLVDDAGGRFELVGNEIRVKTGLDYEAAMSHDIVVKATDATGQEATETLTIAVGDVDEGSQPPAMITIDASTATSGMNFDSYIRGGFLTGTTGGGFPVFDNGGTFDGTEMFIGFGDTSASKYVLMHGHLEYYFDTHTVAGTANTIEYGTRGSGSFDANGFYIGGNVELKITGLDLSNAVPTNSAEEAEIEANGPIHNFAVANMYGYTDANNDGINDYQFRLDKYADSLDAYAQHFIGSAYGDVYAGTQFDDIVEGGGGADLLAGGGGNDAIGGGEGDDTAVFTGNKADYTITDNGDGTWTVTDNRAGDINDGTDTLTGIEFAQFADETVSLVVDANVAPVASDDISATVKNLVKVIDVLGNDTDVDGALDATSVAIVDGPAHGTVSVNATTGAITYTPAAGYVGTDSFTYTVNDNEGQISNTATVSLDVAAAHILTGGDDVFSGDSLGLTGAGIEVHGGDGHDYIVTSNQAARPDVVYGGEGNDLIFVGGGDDYVDGGAGDDVIHGRAGNDTLIGGEGNDTFVIRFTDNGTTTIHDTDGTLWHGTFRPASYPASWSPAPGATSGYGINGTATIVSEGVWNLAVTDQNGQPVNLTLAWSGDDLTITRAGSPQTVVVADYVNGSFGITLEEPNSAPVDLVLSANEIAENSATGTVIGTLSATDVDGDTLTYTIENDPDGKFALVNDAGVTKLVVNGSLDFEAAASHNVTVKVSDGNGGEATQSFTVSVTDVDENVAPVASDDASATVKNLVKVIDVLGNDTDANGTLDVTSVAIVDSPAHGTVSVNATTGAITYTPAAGYVGTDSFTYTVKDNDGQISNTATVSLDVAAAHILTDGDDVFSGDSLGLTTAGVEVHGGDGHDYIVTSNQAAQPDIVYGGEGNDLIFVGRGDDYVDGGAGDDVIHGRAGNDTLVGGEGDDTFVIRFTDNGTTTIHDTDGALWHGTFRPASYPASWSPAPGATSGYGIGGIATVVSAGVWNLAVTDQNGQPVNLTLAWSGDDLTITYADNPQTVVIADYVNGTFGITLESPGGNGDLVGTDGTDHLVGTDGADIIDAKSGDDIVAPGSGHDLITLGDGADTLRGSATDFAGDHVTDFAPLEDKLVFDNPAFDFSNIKGFAPDAGGLSVFFGELGDLDNGLRLDGDFDGLGAVYAREADGSVVIFDKALGEAQFHEGQQLDPTLSLGTDSLSSLLLPRAGEDFTITLQGNLQAAGYDNSLIAYQVADDGTLTHVQLLAANVKNTSGPLIYADAIEGLEVGFAVVQNGGAIAGFTNNSNIGLAVDPASDSFVFSVDGITQNASVFFSHDSALNLDHLEHVVVGAEDGWTGSAIFGFEDLLGGGDADFQDVVFSVNINHQYDSLV